MGKPWPKAPPRFGGALVVPWSMETQKRVGQSEQEEQNNMGTRGSRDAGGERSQRVKRGKGEASTEGQKGMGEQGEREADAATGGACIHLAPRPVQSEPRTEAAEG